jgi:methylamine--corrinoid protein Co-methyltransferase
MISIIQAQERSENGPVMTERDFNRKYQLTLREIADKYRKDLILVPEETIPVPEYGDAVYEAAVDLVTRVGAYNTSTNRVIEFSNDEIVTTANTTKSELILGEGTDKVIVRARSIGDPNPPINFIGPTGFPYTPEYFFSAHLSYAKVPEAHGLMVGTLIKARGIFNKIGTPAELICALTEASMMRELLRQAGRPGMPMAEVPCSGISPAAIIASYNANGYSPKTSLPAIQLFPGLKISWERLILMAWAQEFGIQPWVGYWQVTGTYERDALETAIATVAGDLAVLAMSHGTLKYGCAISVATLQPRGKLTESLSLGPVQNPLQTDALKVLALQRNVHNLNAYLSGAGAPCTPQAVHITALLGFFAAAAGFAVLSGGMGGPGNAAAGTAINYATGMEGKALCEGGLAGTGLDRHEANKIIKRTGEFIGTSFEAAVRRGAVGKPFPECYDVERCEPTDEYKRIYAEAKNDMREHGFPFKY